MTAELWTLAAIVAAVALLAGVGIDSLAEHWRRIQAQPTPDADELQP